MVFLGAAVEYAQGELIEYEFQGGVTDNSGVLGVFGPFGTVQINDEFTGRFAYMTGPGNPDQDMADPEIGIYDLIDFVIDQAVVDITPLAIAVRHRPGVPTLDPLPLDPGTDGFNVIGSFMLGEDTKTVALRLEAPYETVFMDDSLPTTLTLSDFPDLQIVRSIRVLGLEPIGMSQIDEGHLISLVKVPEPSTVALAVLGFYGVGLMRRCRRRKGVRTIY